MASVEQILRRASRYTGLRYDGAEDTGSEAEILREALEDVYIDVMMETQPVERNFDFTVKNTLATQSIETYDEYLKFATQDEEGLRFAGGDTQTLAGDANPSGKITVTSSPAGTTYTEGVDYTVDRNAADVPISITRIPAGSGGSIPNVAVDPAFDALITYFLQDPRLLINDDLIVPPFLKIRNIIYSQSTAASYPLVHVSTNEILEYRRGFESTGYTRMYSVSGNGLINLWPRPQAGDRIRIIYVPLPPKLDEIDNRPAGWDTAIWDLSEYDDVRGVESRPSLIPIQFHWNTLLPGVVVQAFDKDQRVSDVQHWQSRYEAGLAKMHLWMATYGNVEPAPVFDSLSPRFNSWPDQYSRQGWSN